MIQEAGSGCGAEAELRRRGVKKIQRVLIYAVDGGVPDLEKCTATRQLCPDGTLLEVIDVDGSADLLDMDKLQEWLLSIPVKTLEECRTDRRDTSELGDSIFRDPARSTPAREPQLFIEPGRETPPSALASVEPEAPKEVTTKPATWPPERDPIAEEKTRRENRRLDVPPIDATETSYQAEMRRQEEMRRDRKRFGPTLPPIDLR